MGNDLTKTTKAIKYLHETKGLRNKKVIINNKTTQLANPQELAIRKLRDKLLLQLRIQHTEHPQYNEICKAIKHTMKFMIEEEFTVDLIKTDFDGEDEDSQIMCYIEDTVEAFNRQSKVYCIISSIFRYVLHYDGLILCWRVTLNEIETASKLFRHAAPSIFKTNKKDKALSICKAIDITNNIPILTLFVDLYSRNRIRKYSKSITNMKQYNVSTFFSEHNYVTNTNQIHSVLQETMIKNHFVHGTSGIIRRIRPRICLENQMTIIDDKLNAFVNYIVGATRFIQDNIIKIWKENHVYDNSLHFDFWIIPQSVIDINEIMDGERKKQIYADNVKYEKQILRQTKYRRLLSNEDVSSIRNIRTYLCKSSKFDIINNLFYTQYDHDNCKQNIREIAKTYHRLMRNFDSNFPENTNNKRYIYIIDRRIQINKGKKDIIYAIKPSDKYDTVHEKCDVFPESFFSKSMDWLLPQIKNKKRALTKNNIGTISKMNGYMFCVSFHVYSINCIRAYWSFKHGTERFFIDDMNSLWPKHFVFDHNQSSLKPTPQKADIDYHLIKKLKHFDPQYETLRLYGV
eukprot:433346_1